MINTVNCFFGYYLANSRENTQQRFTKIGNLTLFEGNQGWDQYYYDHVTFDGSSCLEGICSPLQNVKLHTSLL
jgi:hypothetical protein